MFQETHQTHKESGTLPQLRCLAKRPHGCWSFPGCSNNSLGVRYFSSQLCLSRFSSICAHGHAFFVIDTTLAKYLTHLVENVFTSYFAKKSSTSNIFADSIIINVEPKTNKTSLLFMPTSSAICNERNGVNPSLSASCFNMFVEHIKMYHIIVSLNNCLL